MINASGQLWKAMPEYAVEPASAAKAAAATTHMNVMFAIVVGVAAVVVVLVYGPRDLSRHPREVPNTPYAGSGEPTAPRVR
jgi:FlaG/FlaF family flagellin (archaellin)